MHMTVAAKVMTGALASTVVAVLPLFLLGGLASLIEDELGFGAAALGGAASYYFGASALASLPGGRFDERLGPRRSLACGVILSYASLAGTALLRSWTQLVVLMILAGIANNTVQPAANLALAHSVPSHRQGMALGIKQSAVPRRHPRGQTGRARGRGDSGGAGPSVEPPLSRSSSSPSCHQRRRVWSGAHPRPLDWCRLASAP